MNKLSVLFWLRKNKMNKQGRCPIYCRITLGGVRAKEFSTGQSVVQEQWCSKSQTSDDEIVNICLQQLRNKTSILYVERLNKNEEITAEILKEIVTGKIEENITFIRLIERFMEEKARLVDTEGCICFNSYNKNLQYIKNIKKYCKCNISAKSFRCENMNELKLFLLDKGFKLSYTNRHLKFIKQVYRWGAAQDIINVSPILAYALKHEKTPPPIFLTNDEVAKIEAHTFASHRLQQVADCFLFQCYSGCAYIDLSSICEANIIELKERLFLTYNRAKTNENAIVPMCDKLKKLLQKYHYKLPVLTNQKYNAYLKEVAEIVGIEKRISTHTGRKTFANHMINNTCFSIESVARMLGHAKIQTTQEHYGRVSVDRLLKEIKEKELEEVA